MEIILSLLDFILHADKHLIYFASEYHEGLYLILFFIIFCETGLVVTPFLPGDSLLFAAGALAVQPEAGISVYILCLILIIAAITGDLLNYYTGKTFGEKIVQSRFRIIPPAYLLKTEKFFQKYGNRTIVFARFFPIVRTFAPFFAGIGRMPFAQFLKFNITGGVVWVTFFLFAGYFFGNIPVIKRNFSLTVLAIIFISLLPIIVGFIRSKIKPVAPVVK